MTYSSFKVTYDGSFNLSQAPTRINPSDFISSGKSLKKQLRQKNSELAELQRILYADNRYSVLLIFQAMDAAGKDSTIRAVLRGVNPAGCQVHSFKQPSTEELDHDFLWRSATRLPERGRIGVFNRSYYEEALVVRVHPEYLDFQRLPLRPDLNTLWSQRFASICDHEKHLANNGTLILKFWLNVSRDEQKKRFLSRLDVPEKNWKFSSGDVRERGLWTDYMHAYEQVLQNTSREFAPWFAIPADDKPLMRLMVASIVVDQIKQLDIDYPTVDAKERTRFDEMRSLLENEMR